MNHRLTTKSAADRLAVLAQRTRLDILRLLIKQSAGGLPVGALSEQLRIPLSTLSFHCRTLSQAGLVTSRSQGRFVYYSARFDTMLELIEFLGEGCSDKDRSELH